MNLVGRDPQWPPEAGDDPRRMLFELARPGPAPEPDAGPLVCLSGALMVDCGSEPPSYLYASQARYPPYAALLGARCLLWARDDEHATQLRERFVSLRQRWELIAVRSPGVSTSQLRAPAIVGGHVQRQPALVAGVGDAPGSITEARVFCNQLAPRLSALLDALLATRSSDAARLTYGLHDKRRCVDLLAPVLGPALPVHVATTIIAQAELERIDYAQLCARLNPGASTREGTELFFKSSLDAAGEVAVSTDEPGFVAAIASLRAQIHEKVAVSERADAVEFLVQPRIPTDAAPTRPTTVGVTYRVDASGGHELITIAGHLYRTSARRVFVGTILDDALTTEVVAAIGPARMTALLDAFAAAGYRGPINIDMVRRDDGEYVSIYDCNPRMGGALPAAAVRGALRRAGYGVRTIINPGYHGRTRVPDLAAKLDALDAAGLLVTHARPRGVMLIPSFVHADGYDWFFVDVALERARELWASGALFDGCDPGLTGPATLHF